MSSERARRYAASSSPCGGGPVRVAVHHFAAPEAATGLAATLEERLAETGADVVSLVHSEVTAVVGAHTGPGVVGVALAPE